MMVVVSETESEKEKNKQKRLATCVDLDPATGARITHSRYYTSLTTHQAIAKLPPQLPVPVVLEL